jgi:hypothetical protein
MVLLPQPLSAGIIVMGSVPPLKAWFGSGDWGEAEPAIGGQSFSCKERQGLGNVKRKKARRTWEKYLNKRSMSKYLNVRSGT